MLDTDTILMIVGGTFYLAAKVFFLLREATPTESRKLQYHYGAWLTYLLGLPAIVIFLIRRRDWIAASLEAAATPIMISGLLAATKDLRRGKAVKKVASPWLQWFVYLVIPIGVLISVRDFGGLRTWNQALELGMIVGFLAGTSLLEQRKSLGYLFLLGMIASCGTLMYRQHRALMVVQQAVSAACVLAAYVLSRRRHVQS